MVNLLSPKQVAVAIGVSDASLKRWCDKGLIDAIRTPGGHRKLLLASVVQFIRSTGQSLARPELLGLPAATRTTAPSIEQAVQALVDALRAGNAEQSRTLLLGTYLAGQSLQHICDDIIAPAFERLGHAWEHGQIEVFQERRAVEICLAVLHEARTALPPPLDSAPQAVGGTLSGDLYALPTLMAELTVREAGWNAQSLGCGLPAATLAAAARDVRPKLLWLSVSHVEPAAPAPMTAALRSIAAEAEVHGVTLAVGGRGMSDALRTSAPTARWCAKLADLAALAREIAAP